MFEKSDTKEADTIRAVKSFSDNLRVVTDDYWNMKATISLIYHTLHENVDIDDVYVRINDDEIRQMAIEILKGIVELKGQSNDRS